MLSVSFVFNIFCWIWFCLLSAKTFCWFQFFLILEIRLWYMQQSEDLDPEFSRIIFVMDFLFLSHFRFSVVKEQFICLVGFSFSQGYGLFSISKAVLIRWSTHQMWWLVVLGNSTLLEVWESILASDIVGTRLFDGGKGHTTLNWNMYATCLSRMMLRSELWCGLRKKTCWDIQSLRTNPKLCPLWEWWRREDDGYAKLVEGTTTGLQCWRTWNFFNVEVNAGWLMASWNLEPSAFKII